MKLYTNDLDRAIHEDYTPKEDDGLIQHTIVESVFRAGKMPPKVSELPISSATFVDCYPNEETARRYNQSWLGIGTRKSNDNSAPAFNYRFFGDTATKSFMDDMNVGSIEELVGKEILRVEQKSGQVLGYSPKE